MSDFTLNYWALRGLGQPCRALAEYLELNYTENNMTLDQYNNYQTRANLQM